jgi:uncharacterized protein with GYD domain
MGQSEEAWNEVGEHFKSLGSIFKVHYLAQGEGDPMELVADDEVKEALRTLGVSLKAVFATVGDTIADPEIRDETRQTASSFLDALGATFSDLGQDISKRGDSQDRSGHSPPESTASQDSTGVEE